MLFDTLALAAREVKGAGFASILGRDTRLANFVTLFYIFNINFFGVLTKAWQFRAGMGLYGLPIWDKSGFINLISVTGRSIDRTPPQEVCHDVTRME
ncbi:hypothetical protein K9F62_16135 [Desulfovibrio sp. JY]|nr:hypothetical protein K9F62_16135 [Desulfovibrio sp. JY]